MADIPDYMRGFDLDQDYGFTPVNEKPDGIRCFRRLSRETAL